MKITFNDFLNEEYNETNLYEINFHGMDLMMSIELIEEIDMYGIIIRDISTDEVYLKANITNDEEPYLYMIDVENKRESWATDFFIFIKKWWFEKFGKELKHSEIHSESGKKWVQSLDEDYFHKFGGDKVVVDKDDFIDERDGLKPGDKYMGFVPYEDYYCERCKEYDEEDIEVEIIVEPDCDDLEIRISKESAMWDDRDSSGQIIFHRIGANDLVCDGDYCCDYEWVNNFIIYDDGNTAWDNSLDSELYDEVVLYIYFFFNLTPKVRKVFEEYYEYTITDEDDLENFKKKYEKELIEKDLDKFDI